MELGLGSKTALVTGSYRGTGAGIAKVLAGEGARVFVHGVEPGQPDEVVAAITAAGGAVESVLADLRTDAGLQALAAALRQTDVLVANQGAPVGSSWDSSEHWADEWNQNVMVGTRAAQVALPAMRDRGWGRVIFIGTVGTRMPGARNPGYYGAKAALPVIVRTLAMELRGSGVTANLVSPGMIATAEVREMLARRASKHGIEGEWSDVERWAVDHAMPNLTGRIPTPDDIGAVVAFVASEAAWHLNGADIAVDGGAVDAR